MMPYVKYQYDKHHIQYIEELPSDIQLLIDNLKENYILCGSCLYFYLGLSKKRMFDVDILAIGEKDKRIKGYDNCNQGKFDGLYARNIVDYGLFKGLDLETAIPSTFSYKYKKTKQQNRVTLRASIYLLELITNLYLSNQLHLTKSIINDDVLDLKKDIEEDNYYNIIQYIARYGIPKEIY